MSTERYYRHPVTGIIGSHTPEFAEIFGLVEVGKDAKPLAFTPIPEAKVADLKKKDD
jgi:hypothetical protein